MRGLFHSLLALAAVSIASSAAGAPRFEIAPPSAWVELAAMPVSPAPPDASGGVDYLLLDDQVRIGAGPLERYRRFVRRVLSSKGVEGASELRIDFDPGYQSLVLHEVVIWRGSARIPASLKDVKLIQREPELDRQIYDGRTTAVLFLRDVRQGDVVDASWTLRGQNPVFAGRWTQAFQLGWSVPVARSSLRVALPMERPLAWRAHGLTLTPAASTRHGQAELRFERFNVPAVQFESEVPEGVDALPWLELSEWRSWDEVVRWALPLYSPGSPSPAMEAKLAAWRELPDREEQARAALRFVQDEVRYLGIELGEASHRPTPPAEVFERRFGDCKDKSLLLVSLLRALGFDAAPALVNTEEGAAVAGRLPAPSAFDHVIVRARVDGAWRWLEPTRSLERASISAVVPPPYRRALVLSPGEAALTDLPDPIASPLEVTSTWRVARFGEPGLFEVATRYEGLRAIGMRHELAVTSTADLQRRNLDRYAHDDPGIEVAAPLEVADAPGQDQLTITEHYRLPPIRDGAERDFFAETIRDQIHEPGTARRTLPLRIPYPVAMHERLRVELPGPPAISSDKQEVVSEAARLSLHARAEGHSYLVDLDYQTLRPSVDPKGVAEHIAKVREMRRLTGSSLTLAVQRPLAPGQPFPWVALVLVGVVVAGFSAVLFDADLRQWWDAFRQRRRRRAFAQKKRETSGESPQTAISVRSGREVSADGVRVRCRCGARLASSSDPAEPITFGGRELQVLRARCSACEQTTAVYFVVE